MAGRLRNQSIAQQWAIGLGTLVALMVLYFVLPTETQGPSTEELAFRVVISTLAFGTVGWVVVWQIRRLVQGRAHGPMMLHLMLLLEIVLVVFALTYFFLAMNFDDEMVGLQTRLDSLYFTATTLTTVGFGDIYAHGQIARAITTIQLVFDVVFVASIAGLVNRRLREVSKD